MFFDCCVDLEPLTDNELFCSGPCGFAVRLNLLFSVCKEVLKATQFLRKFDPSTHIWMSYVPFAVLMRTEGSCLFSPFQHKRGV